jgi:benzaldehyde dehydrogenase (NAD)
VTWLDRQRWQGRIYSGGLVPGSAGERAVVAPATGDELGSIGMASPDDVAKAAATAKDAQRAWVSLPYTQRAAVLRKAGDLITEHAGEIQDWIIRESGSVPGKAELETHLGAQECYEAAGLPSRAFGELMPSELPRRSWAQRVPVGVVGVIAPFNVPLILSIRSVAPALALGNAVVLKPDPRTAVCGGVVLAEVFAAAGLPDGLLHVLPGGVDVGEAVVTEPAIRTISFTGSTAAGRRVGELAGAHLKRVHLELGGNSGLIVLDDVDLPRAVSAGAWGSFLHQGQICMTTGRHLVHESVYDDYVAGLAETADHLPVGDPSAGQVALGPLIDEHQRDKVHGLVTASVAAGATLAAGGEYTGLVLPADRAGGQGHLGTRVRGGGLRAGRARGPVRLAGRGGRAGRGQRLRPVAGHSDPGRAEGPRPGRPHPHRHRAHQRPDSERRGTGALRWSRGLRHRCQVRRRGSQRGRLHRNPVGHRPRRHRAVSVLGK